MAWMLDTNIAIGLRDGDTALIQRVAELDGPVMLSVVTRVELEGGVYRMGAEMATRHARLDLMLAGFAVAPFDDAAADRYRQIVAALGYSRPKILDRMIAAQALVHHATLATTNPKDFAEIPELRTVVW